MVPKPARSEGLLETSNKVSVGLRDGRVTCRWVAGSAGQGVARLLVRAEVLVSGVHAAWKQQAGEPGI